MTVEEIYQQEDRNKEIFKNTKRMYSRNRRLKRSISSSKRRQKIYYAEDDMAEINRPYQETEVILSKKRTLEAAGAYRGKRVCVLNFASFVRPALDMLTHTDTQEECLCRCSTLFPCLNERKTKRKFYKAHRKYLKLGWMSRLYNDDCIYTPDVTVFKTDTEHPEAMPDDDWYNVDVITCAAPMTWAEEFGWALLRAVHRMRIGRILDVAADNGAEVVILGAFGCGAFVNPPEIVAEAMSLAIKERQGAFETIEIAIPVFWEDDENYHQFDEVFSHWKEDGGQPDEKDDKS